MKFITIALLVATAQADITLTRKVTSVENMKDVAVMEEVEFQARCHSLTIQPDSGPGQSKARRSNVE